jgi:hypothetical protein
MGDVVEARAVQALLLQSGNGFMEFTAPVFEGGGGAAHLSDEALEDLGHRFARPGVCHTDPQTMDPREREGAGSALRVMGLNGQDGHDFPWAQANTAIDPPEEAGGKGGLAQREAPKGAGRVETHDGEPDDPLDDGVRARRFVDAQGQSQESEDARDGAKANARDEKKLESQGEHVDLGYGGEAMELGLELTQVGLRRLEGGGDSVALRLAASALLALGTLALAALLGLVCPLISTVVHCGAWAHHVSSGQLDGLRPCHGVAVGRKMRP